MTQPTEPIPYVPPPDQMPPRSWLRRHLASAAAIAVGLAVAAIAIGFGVAAARSGDSTWTATSPATTPPADASSSSTPTAVVSSNARLTRDRAATGRTIVRAVIVSTSDSSWRVRTRAGVLATVVITPETRFGIDGDPASSDRFGSGDDVVIVGSLGDGTLTADRIMVGRPNR